MKKHYVKALQDAFELGVVYGMSWDSVNRLMDGVLAVARFDDAVGTDEFCEMLSIVNGAEILCREFQKGA